MLYRKKIVIRERIGDKVVIIERKTDRQAWVVRHGFRVGGYDPNGGCPFHPTAGSYLVRDYELVDEEGNVQRMALGWICAGCLKEKMIRDGAKWVAGRPIPGSWNTLRIRRAGDESQEDRPGRLEG